MNNVHPHIQRVIGAHFPELPLNPPQPEVPTLASRGYESVSQVWDRLPEETRQRVEADHWERCGLRDLLYGDTRPTEVAVVAAFRKARREFAEMREAEVGEQLANGNL